MQRQFPIYQPFVPQTLKIQSMLPYATVCYNYLFPWPRLVGGIRRIIGGLGLTALGFGGGEVGD